MSLGEGTRGSLKLFSFFIKEWHLALVTVKLKTPLDILLVSISSSAGQGSVWAQNCLLLSSQDTSLNRDEVLLSLDNIFKRFVLPDTLMASLT